MILYRVAYQLQNKRYLGCRIFAVSFNENDDEDEDEGENTLNTLVSSRAARGISHLRSR